MLVAIFSRIDVTDATDAAANCPIKLDEAADNFVVTSNNQWSFTFCWSRGRPECMAEIYDLGLGETTGSGKCKLLNKDCNVLLLHCIDSTVVFLHTNLTCIAMPPMNALLCTTI